MIGLFFPVSNFSAADNRDIFLSRSNTGALDRDENEM